jgi:hypothetical protein
VESLAVVKAEFLVTKAAAVAKGDNRRAGAGTGTAAVRFVVTAEVDKAGDKVLLRVNV